MRLKLLEPKEEMCEGPEKERKKTNSLRDYPNAAWMNLGALNAHKSEPIHAELMQQHLEVVDVSLAYKLPDIFVAVENGVQRSARTDPRAGADPSII